MSNNDQLPTFNKLLDDALTVYHRYASLDAYERALSKQSSTTHDPTMAIPTGKVWAPPRDSTLTEARPEVAKEEEGFDGDRTLANSILFLHEYSTWVELAHATPEGDIGRVWEIIKVRCQRYIHYMRYSLSISDLHFFVRMVKEPKLCSIPS